MRTRQLIGLIIFFVFLIVLVLMFSASHQAQQAGSQISQLTLEAAARQFAQP